MSPVHTETLEYALVWTWPKFLKIFVVVELSLNRDGLMFDVCSVGSSLISSKRRWACFNVVLVLQISTTSSQKACQIKQQGTTFGTHIKHSKYYKTLGSQNNYIIFNILYYSIRPQTLLSLFTQCHLSLVWVILYDGSSRPTLPWTTEKILNARQSKYLHNFKYSVLF
jgi:hypothetical protein